MSSDVMRNSEKCLKCKRKRMPLMGLWHSNVKLACFPDNHLSYVSRLLHHNCFIIIGIISGFEIVLL